MRQEAILEAFYCLCSSMLVEFWILEPDTGQPASSLTAWPGVYFLMSGARFPQVLAWLVCMPISRV